MSNNNFFRDWTPRVLSLLRLMGGLLILQHGLQKVFGMFGGPAAPVATLMGAAGVIELAGGILLAVGLFTRPVAFILSGQMAVAYFMEHAPHGFIPLENKGELAVAYCFIYFYLFFAGGGSISFDRLLTRDVPVTNS